MKLTIDQTAYDIASDFRFDAGYDAGKLHSPETARTGRSVKLQLPRTDRNDTLFASRLSFNAELHTAELTHEGAQLQIGTVRLLSVSREGYTIEIRSGGAEWAKHAALGRFRDIPVNFSGILAPTDIRAGWSDTRPVKFLPVLRDSYEQQNSSTDLQPVLRVLSPDDYHPFIQVKALIEAVFKQAGYTIESRFLRGDFFRSLYLSGAYASRDTAAAEKRMGFYAGRLTTATATADATGRVYATPHGAGNIVGNIVETATPLSADENKIVHTEFYNNGNCFGMDGLKIVYRPASVISVGFEYHLRYTTAHRILTRDQLRGFDSVYLGADEIHSFRLPNRYTDRRSTLKTGTSYRIVVFGSTASTRYRLLYTLNGNPSTLWTDFTGRSTVVTTPSQGTVANPVLYVQNGSAWASYEGDWALYDGHIGETGETTVELTVRTPAKPYGPSSPLYFNTIFFSGAEAGMSFTLRPQCSVRPLFSPAPGYGAQITTADIARHNIRQQVLLEAVQHLFNLRFYTDEPTKTVYIEPEQDFWQQEREAQWQGRTDFGQPIIWEDAALEVHESRTYGYRTGEGAAARLEEKEGIPFGSWHTETGSYASAEGDQKRTNPLFCATANAAGSYAEAPSASLMQVGDRDDLSGDGINFTPRIVRYCGLKPLPAGERWEGQNTYPLAAFHFEGDEAQAGFTLCFGDRDGQSGLHRFYDREEAANASAEHVSLSIRIAPHEFESLFTPRTGAPDLRRVFRITTDRGDCRATLRRIGMYDPVKGIARCTFTLHSNR